MTDPRAAAALAVIVAARNEADLIAATRGRPARGAARRRRSTSPTTPPTDGTAEAGDGRRRPGRQPPPPARQGRQRDRGRGGGAERRAAAGDRAPLRRRSRRLGGAALAPLVEAVRGGRVRPRRGRLQPAARRRLRARARLRPLARSGASAGLETAAPISGQRAMRVEVLRATLPFARGYGMEIGMTVDAVRAGYRLARVRARPRAPCHRSRPARLPPPWPPAGRLRPRLRSRRGGRLRLVEGDDRELDDLGGDLGAAAGAGRRRSRAGSPPRCRRRSLRGSRPGPALPSGRRRGPEEGGEAAEHAIGVVERRRARHRQLEEGQAGEELVVGGVVEQCPQAGADRLRPLRLGRPSPRRPRAGVSGEQVEAGQEGLLLSGEVVVEGLVGDPGGGGDRRDAERLVALLVAEPGRGADDPLALAPAARASSRGSGCRRRRAGARPPRRAAPSLPVAGRSTASSRRSARPPPAARRRCRLAGGGRRSCGFRRRSRARSAPRPRAAKATRRRPARISLFEAL